MDSRPPLRMYYDRAVSKYMFSSQGRCSTCGFLANAVGDEDLEIRSVARDLGIDTSGNLPLGFFCYVNAQPIREELEVGKSGIPNAEAARKVFQKDRKCDDW